MSRSRTLVIAAALVLAGLVTPGSPAQAADDPSPTPVGTPVTQPDRVTVASDGFAETAVLDNDRDPEDPSGRVLVPCRVEPSPDLPMAVVPSTGLDEVEPGRGGRPGLLVVGNDAEPGTYTMTYGVCDLEHLSPATLTIVVTGPREPNAAGVAGRPGFVRFSNPGPRRARFSYGSVDGKTIDRRFTVGPRSARTLRVQRRAILWSATIRTRRSSESIAGVVRGIGRRTGRPHTTTRSAAQRAAAERPAGAPVTTVDTATVPRDGLEVVDVLANDSDPDGPADDLGICRAEAPAGSDLQVVTLVGDEEHGVVAAGRIATAGADGPVPYRLAVAAGPRTPLGTHTISYHACDRRFLTAGTVEVTVTPSQRVTARRLRQRPGLVRFTNPGPRAVTVRVRKLPELDGLLFQRGSLVARFRLPAGATRTIRPGVRRIYWTANGSAVSRNSGTIRGIGRR